MQPSRSVRVALVDRGGFGVHGGMMLDVLRMMKRVMHTMRIPREPRPVRQLVHDRPITPRTCMHHGIMGMFRTASAITTAI